jgi:oligosaccharyltransferase complex subunit epsilon
MAPKRKNAAATTAEPASTTTTTTTSGDDNTSAIQAPSAKAAATARAHPHGRGSPASQLQLGGWDQLAADVYGQYVQNTPQPTKLVDAFLAFLVAVGVLQFAYCVLAGNFPFNAFLSGFSATVGQFVLTASLRVQTIGTYKQEFSRISPERAFADYIVCSLILHFFCISYIN